MNMRIAISLSLLVAVPGLARADGPRHALSVELPSLTAAGLSVQYENFTLPDRWSFAGSVGARSAAQDDYGSLTLSAGAEARYWARGRALGSNLRRSMIGPFVSARVDMARTSMSMEGRAMGSALTLTEMFSAGYRFAAWRGLELTPHAGIGVRTEIDGNGRLPAWTRGTASLGITAGWMF
jgi:hypothetical protein